MVRRGREVIVRRGRETLPTLSTDVTDVTEELCKVASLTPCARTSINAPMRRRIVLVLGAVASAMLAAHLVACGNPSHVFEARLFVEQRQCLGTKASVDVVDGEPPSSPCAPTCLVQPQSDGGRAIYVSTMCGPYPFGFDASGSDPACPAALDALARKDTCFVDGGSSSPAPVIDAGDPDAAAP